MIKSDAVRYIEYPATGKVVIERLWIPEIKSEFYDPEWRAEDETTNSAVSDFSALQGHKAWPFPESAT